MAKFYVNCGSVQWIVDAESARQAAMRLMDELLGEHVWIYDDAELSEQDRRDHLILEALLHLGSEVQVSQRGISRCEAGVFGVPELLEEWHRMMTAVGRLFVAAGISPRRMLPSPQPAAVAPRLPR